nr:hypothetical protein [Caldilineaceae bacterium]
MQRTFAKLVYQALVWTIVLTMSVPSSLFADNLARDSDVLVAGIQSNSTVTVTLNPGGTANVTVGVGVLESGSNHVTFPVAVTAASTGSYLGTPSPTSLSITAYSTNANATNEKTTTVLVTAPTTGLTCGVTNSFSGGKVTFSSAASGLNGGGGSDQVFIALDVNGPPCDT